MENRVSIVFDDKLVLVDLVPFQIKEFVSQHENIHAIQWQDGSGHVEYTDGTPNLSIQDAEDYTTWVAPYVTQWQAEKDAADKAAAEAEAEYNSLENTRIRKLTELNDGLATARADSTISLDSAVGFAINANDTAKSNIDGLITVGVEPVQFMAFDNTLHEVTLADLKTMQLELAAWNSALYAYKWATREAINACETADAVNAITIDYSQASAYYDVEEPVAEEESADEGEGGSSTDDSASGSDDAGTSDGDAGDAEAETEADTSTETVEESATGTDDGEGDSADTNAETEPDASSETASGDTDATITDDGDDTATVDDSESTDDGSTDGETADEHTEASDDSAEESSDASASEDATATDSGSATDSAASDNSTGAATEPNA